MKFSQRLVGAFAIVVVGATSVSLGVLSSASATTVTNPTTILKDVAAAMKAKGSVSLNEVDAVNGSDDFSMTGSSAKNVGTQTLHIGSGVGTLRLIGKSLYFKGNATFFKNYFDISKSPIAGKWVMVPKSNGNYNNFSQGILFASAISNTVQMKDLKYLGAKTIGGKSAIAVSGEPTSGSSDGSGTQVVYVSTKSPGLPLALGFSGTSDGNSITGSLTFSKWGEKVKVSKPSSYVVATSKDLPS